MNETCHADGTTLVQGQRWLSMIYLSSDSRQPDNANSVRWDYGSLNHKLEQVQRTTHLESSRTSPLADRWSAVYGRLEAPLRLHPPSRSGPRRRSGNGYGASGSVPAQLHIMNVYDFPD